MRIISEFMRNIVSKLAKKTIYKKFGYNMDVQFNNINVKIVEGEARIHLDLDTRIEKDELIKILKQIGLN